MMHRYEEAVMSFLTRDPHVFLSPQYAIKGGDGYEPTCPDFVALDILGRHAYIVEVSTAWNLDAIVEKINEADQDWIGRLEAMFHSETFRDLNDMKFRVLAFVRAARVKALKDQVSDRKHLRVTALEALSHPWDKKYWENVETFWDQLRNNDDLSTLEDIPHNEGYLGSHRE